MIPIPRNGQISVAGEGPSSFLKIHVVEPEVGVPEHRGVSAF